jgi:hypothetical protein
VCCTGVNNDIAAGTDTDFVGAFTPALKVHSPAGFLNVCCDKHSGTMTANTDSPPLIEMTSLDTEGRVYRR